MRSLSERIEFFKNSDLYPVVSSEFCHGRNACDIVAGIAAGGAKIVQIREKNLFDSAMYELVKKCKAITDQYQMLLIVDDRIDIAMATGADGVHLGQDDFPLKEAKKLAPDLLIGISTHNSTEIQNAMKYNCSYLNIGPIFPTNTKSVPCGALGLEKAEELSKIVSCPFSVMGGIKEHHLKLLSSKGFRHIAMVTEITQAPDVEKQVRQLRKIMKEQCND